MSTDTPSRKPTRPVVPPSMPVQPVPGEPAAAEPAHGVTNPPSNPSRRFGRTEQAAIVICTTFILLFVILSRVSILTKCATYDEALHAVGGYTNLRLGDFRMNFEDPPLWHDWVALPNSAGSIQFDPQDRSWIGISRDTYQEWELSTRLLYETPGNDGGAFVNRSRAMMLILTVILAIILTGWTWKLGGPIAAVIATGLFCLDPTLIAHGSIIKNDVAMALIMLATFLTAWQAGKQVTLLNAIVLAVIIAMGVNTKFSAILLGPMLVVIFAVRVALPWPWLVLGRRYSKRQGKAVVALTMLCLTAVVSYVAIWASYRFRFSPAPDPSVTLNTIQHKTEAIKYRFQATHPIPPELPFDPSRDLRSYLDQLTGQTNAIESAVRQGAAAMQKAELSPQNQAEVSNILQAAAGVVGRNRKFIEEGTFALTLPAETQKIATFNIYQLTEYATTVLYRVQYNAYMADVGDVAPDRFVGLINFFLDHQLLPSAWLHGVLFVHARSLLRSSFLLGEVSPTGFLSYFPLAMLFKSPVATFVLMLGSLAIGIWIVFRKRNAWQEFAWPLACVLLPFGMYMFSAITARLNIGIRHVIPAYPFMYLAAGIILAKSIQYFGKRAILPIAALGVMLMIETVAAFPNYIAYFSFVFGGPEGGIRLLSDSNLDWGQDIPLLVAWQTKHPDVPLAFGPSFDSGGSYFGRVNADFYGLKATPVIIRKLPIDNPPPLTPDVTKDHVLAVSATIVQGTYGGEAASFIKDAKPIEILGGTIYLYDLRQKP